MKPAAKLWDQSSIIDYYIKDYYRKWDVEKKGMF